MLTPRDAPSTARRRTSRPLARTGWLVLAAGALALPSAAAQPAAAASTQLARPGPPPRQAVGTLPRGTVRLAPTAPGAVTGAFRATEAAVTGPALSNIVVSYVNGSTVWTPAAQNAFEAAVSIWEHRVTSSVPIVVTATATAFADPNVLGGAGPTHFYLDDRGTPSTADDVFEAAALYDARTHTDTAGPEVQAEFNPSMAGLYFGTDGKGGPGRIDFESIALHELGHGLGLLGSATFDGNGRATIGYQVNAQRIGVSWDLFAVGDTSTGPQSLLSMPDGSADLTRALRGGPLGWDGPAGVASGGGQVALYAPTTWQPGSSYSHLDEAAYPQGNVNALMTPVLHYGEVVHDPGPVTLGMLQDMGFTVGGGSGGAIDALYTALGGAARLGAPTSAELATGDGRGSYRNYVGGAIYWSPATGAHLVTGAILGLWRAHGADLGPVGFPITDELGTPDGVGRYNHFQYGSIYWTPALGPHEVRGSIRVTWAAMGWEQSALGYPLTDELGAPDGVGRYNYFQGGSIYWTSSTGAQEVHGAIRGTWSALGWETGPLGYPVTGERIAPDGVGRYNHFQGGSIYWTPATGAWEVRGTIRLVWAGLGWERSWLGYPVSNEYAVPGGRAEDFQGGRATWSATTGVVTLTGR